MLADSSEGPYAAEIFLDRTTWSSSLSKYLCPGKPEGNVVTWMAKEAEDAIKFVEEKNIIA